ncbi:hypothetical protein [Bacillus benzoevorans]|uniref:Uncharacterized protein n=1 Tax=Bacillus benzoevorans TaxID=1456 RepID=A0A7X0HV40_9BACI|nr:hypothetical protein [Bacillus benzoevorans]MBB6446477.1 hypothetical protein [Bacillus benzoevorans]
MNPTMRDQLKDLTKQHPELAPKKSKSRQKHTKRKSEVLTESDIRSLMKSDKPILHRGKGGAWK